MSPNTDSTASFNTNQLELMRKLLLLFILQLLGCILFVGCVYA